jgi:hypothetical protein
MTVQNVGLALSLSAVSGGVRRCSDLAVSVHGVPDGVLAIRLPW